MTVFFVVVVRLNGGSLINGLRYDRVSVFFFFFFNFCVFLVQLLKFTIHLQLL